MKPFILKVLFLIFSVSVLGQEKQVKTLSSDISNLSNLLVQHFEDVNNNGQQIKHNIVFLVQLQPHNMALEDKIILKQALRLLSNRIDGENTVSLIGFEGKNGIGLKQTPIKDLKTILNSIENFHTSIKSSQITGMDLAYSYIEEYHDVEAQNTVVIVRNPKPLGSGVKSNLLSSQPKEESKNGKVLITAIAILPELISIIKD